MEITKLLLAPVTAICSCLLFGLMIGCSIVGCSTIESPEPEPKTASQQPADVVKAQQEKIKEQRKKLESLRTDELKRLQAE